MVRGLREGTATKAVLIERLQRAVPAAAHLRPSTPLPTVLGHAIHHNLVSAKEIEETSLRTETTLPCYLFTYVTNPAHRSKIEEYVKVASRLYRRGTLILNLLAQSVCGPRLPGATDIRVSVWRPPWRADGAVIGRFREMARLLEPPDGLSIESNTLKHAFLPERWPSRGARRRAEVVAILDNAVYGPILPRVPPGWSEVMPCTGWDNAINRMMSKFCGNVKVHAMANLVRDVKAYLAVVPLSPDAPRWALIDAVTRPLRPLVVSHDDWDMAMDLRRILMGESAGSFVDERGRWFVFGYAPDTVSFSQDVLLLHLFLARYGVSDRTYFPVASRGRKYCYIDAKVAGGLFGKSGSKAGPSDESVSSSVNVGLLLCRPPRTDAGAVQPTKAPTAGFDPPAQEGELPLVQCPESPATEEGKGPMGASWREPHA